MAATRKGAGRWVALARKMGDTSVKTETEAENYVKFAVAEVVLDQGAEVAQVAETLGVPVAEIKAWVKSNVEARGGTLPESRPSSPASVRPPSPPARRAAERTSDEPAKSKGYLQELRKAQAAAVLPPRSSSLSRRLAEAGRLAPASGRPLTARTTALEEATPDTFGRAVRDAVRDVAGEDSARAPESYRRAQELELGEIALARAARAALPASFRAPVSERALESYQRAQGLGLGEASARALTPITARSPVTPTAPPAPPPARMAKVEELLQEELVKMRATPTPRPSAPPVQLPPAVGARSPRLSPALSYEDKISACTRETLVEALTRTGGNKRRAARELGMSRPGLYKALARVGLPTVGRV